MKKKEDKKKTPIKSWENLKELTELTDKHPARKRASKHILPIWENFKGTQL